MSSVRATVGSRATFVADNGRDEITRFVNDRYPASRIDPTVAYPTGYEVVLDCLSCGETADDL